MSAPTLQILAARRYPVEWAALPTHAKVLFALAEGAGLTIFYVADTEEDIPPDKRNLWLWGGEVAAFRASGLFPDSMNWDFEGWASCSTADGLRVDLNRKGQIIFATHRGFAAPDRKRNARFVELAKDDAGFQRFRAAALAPLPAWSEWVDDFDGPAHVWIVREVLADYKGRGVFGALWYYGQRWTLCLPFAEAIYADAEHRAANSTGRLAVAYRNLAKRLGRELADCKARSSPDHHVCQEREHGQTSEPGQQGT